MNYSVIIKMFFSIAAIDFSVSKIFHTLCQSHTFATS